MGPLAAAFIWAVFGTIYASLGYVFLLLFKKWKASLRNVFSIVIGGAGGVAIAMVLSFLVWHGGELTGAQPLLFLGLMAVAALVGSGIGLKVAGEIRPSAGSRRPHCPVANE